MFKQSKPFEHNMGQNSMFFFKGRYYEKNRRESMAVDSALSGGGFYSETSGVTEKHVAKSEVILCAGAGNQFRMADGWRYPMVILR